MTPKPTTGLYHSYGINWMWYAEIEIVDRQTARIVKDFRLHKYRDEHPKTIGSYEVLRFHDMKTREPKPPQIKLTLDDGMSQTYQLKESAP